jgi:hypothetical protein
MNDQTRVSVSKDQVSCNLEGDVVVLDLKNSTYYELNPVAARIWELLQTPTTVGDLRRTIEDEYDVSPDRLRADITQLLGTLDQHELLTVHEGSDAHDAATAP